MDMNGLMIEAIQLRRSFKGKEAVGSISFSVQHGEIFGLLGPNGAGKTTTIQLLSGQIHPSGGRGIVAGWDVVTERDQLKERIGVVFEEQNPPMNVSKGTELAKVYAPLALPVSLIVGTSFMPQLLIEEKGIKALRMLMVSPASFSDVLVGKLLSDDLGFSAVGRKNLSGCNSVSYSRR